MCRAVDDLADYNLITEEDCENTRLAIHNRIHPAYTLYEFLDGRRLTESKYRVKAHKFWEKFVKEHS